MEDCATSALRLPKSGKYKLLSRGYGLENVQIQISNNFFWDKPILENSNSTFKKI